MYSSSTQNKPLFDVQAEFNAKQPVPPTPSVAYNHTARLGIQLKSARPATRSGALAGNTRQARSAPVKRPLTQTAHAADSTNGHAQTGGGGKSVTFVDDLMQVVPLYDEMNMHRSHTTASFGGSSKIRQLPLHPETEPVARRFTYSCKSRIMPLPMKECEAPSPPPRAASGTRLRSAQTLARGRPVTPRSSVPLTPRSLFMLHAPPGPAVPPEVRGGGEQAQRFRDEHLANQRLRLMRSLSELQSHRVDRRYYVSGQGVSLEPRYGVSEGAIEELMRARREQMERNIAASGDGVAIRQRRATGTAGRSSIPRKPVTAATRAPSILKKASLPNPTTSTKDAVDGPEVQGGAEQPKPQPPPALGSDEEESGGQPSGAVSVSLSIGGVPVAAAGTGHKDQSDYGSLEEGDNRTEA